MRGTLTDAVPGKGEDSEMDAAARADPLDFPGAISKDVHQGLGKPAGALAGTRGVSSEARNAATDDAGDPTRRWGRNLSEEMEKRGKGTGSVAYSGAERLPTTRPPPSENRPRTPSWGVALGLLWTHKRFIEFPLPQWAGRACWRRHLSGLARIKRARASPSETTSAYFASRSNKFALWMSSLRSPHAGPTTCERRVLL